MSKFKIMGIAVSRGRIAYVVLSGEEKVLTWGVSKSASHSSETIIERVTGWIEEIDPGAVVTEKVGSNARKRGRTHEVMKAVFEAVARSSALNMTTTKVRHHKDKYREARALAEEFPELLDQLPKKPACWDNEPRRMILFEALSFALRLRETRQDPDQNQTAL
ncbi:hypothetical protein [Roseibium sp. M-1]